MKNLKYLTTLVILILLSSCKNYYITLDSFKKQFADANAVQKNNEQIGNNYKSFSGQTYLTASMVKIKCTDKKGNPHELTNGPSIETRITYVPMGKRKKRRTVFYFETVKVTDSTVSGLGSMFLGMPKVIPIDSIKKIEVQNGGKKFS